MLTQDTIDKLEKTCETILKEYKSFCMSDCDNCIFGKSLVVRGVAALDLPKTVYDEGRDWFELDSEQAIDLYDETEWPKRFRNSDLKIGSLEYAQNAVDRIKHFINTGE